MMMNLNEIGAKRLASQPRLLGHDAIAFARHCANGPGCLNKFCDPIEDAVSGISIEDAESVCQEDPSLIWCDTDGGL